MWVRRAAHVKKNVQSCFEIHFSKRLFYAQKQGIAVSAFPFLILSIRALIEKESCFTGFSAFGGSLQRHVSPLHQCAFLRSVFYFIGAQFPNEIKKDALTQDFCLGKNAFVLYGWYYSSLFFKCQYPLCTKNQTPCYPQSHGIFPLAFRK